MRKALVAGLDYYATLPSLHGCVRDAYAVMSMLSHHGDADSNINFELQSRTAGSEDAPLTRANLRAAVRDLFEGEGEVALLYFAGHGHSAATGGYLCTSDCHAGDDGLALAEVLTVAAQSKIKNKIIVLDCCHAGSAASNPLLPGSSELSEGMTILAACTATQVALERNGSGLFTSLLVDALGGAAANVIGDITPGSVYAHIDQSLGAWLQRPVFKTNVKSFVSLRKVRPSVPRCELRRLTEFFPEPGMSFRLSPKYEPESGEAVPELTADFAVLQRYNRVNLVVPVDAPHMYHAAMTSTGCKLTALGEHYRRLVRDNLI